MDYFFQSHQRLIFSMKDYSIHSLDNLATGALLDYEIEKTDFLNGTNLSATYLDSDDFPVNSMMEAVKDFCKKSNLKDTEIKVNGEIVKERADVGEFQKQLLTEDNSFIGDVFAIKGEKSYYINVLCRGLFMFSRYVGEMEDKITVDVKIPSKEAFAQSRDSFKGAAEKSFNKFVSSVTLDTESWHKVRPPIKVMKGLNSYWNLVLNKVSQILNMPEEKLREMTKEETGVVWARFWAMAPTIQAKEEIEELQNQDRPNVSFYFDGGNSGKGDLPEEYNPKHGLKRNRMLAALFRAMIEDVAECAGNSLQFCIGFTFDSDALAAYKEQDGVDVFFLNPLNEKVTKGDMKTRFYNLYSYAIHEKIHQQGYSNHDEGFSCELTRMIGVCMANTKGYVKIMEKARQYEDNL